MSFIDKNKYINNGINSERKNNRNQDINYFIKKRRSIIRTKENEKTNIINNTNFSRRNSKKIIERNVTINNNKNKTISQYKIRYYEKNIKEEEKNYLNKKNAININQSTFFKKKFRPNKIKVNINTTPNFFVRTNSKSFTQKILTSYNNKNKIENEDINDTKKRKIKRLKTLNPSKNNIQQKSTEKKNQKRLLFLKLKELLEEIEKEKFIKDGRLKDMSHLFLERSVKPQIPNLKNRMKLNKYLINDFKENESYQDYIQRSLKYKRIHENYENYENDLILKKEANKYSLKDINLPDSDNESEKNIKKLRRSSLIINKTVQPKKKNYYILTPNTTKITLSLQKKKSEDNFIKKYSSKNLSNTITPIIKDYKNKIYQIKRNSIKNFNLHFNKEEKSKSNINDSFLQDDFLTDRPPKKTFQKRKTEVFSSEKAILLKTRSFFPIKQKKKTTFPKKKMIFDKFTISNNIYNEQKKYFDKYLMNKRITRSKNFSEQMSNLAKEKDLFRNNVDETGSLPKLKEGSLIYEMKLKNLFRNSFNPMANFKEGDEDLDLDNLKKIKNLVVEMEVEMFTSLKDEINPKYIKNKFNKTTVGKYHSTRGVYFGSK